MTNEIDLISLLERDKTVSGEALANELGISRQALHKQIQLLRKSGYQIEGKQKIGYSLILKPDIFNLNLLKSRLTAKKLGKNILYFQTVDSTQNKAKELAEKGAEEGTLILAEKQTQGRGRFSRRWFSEEGGIWTSLLLRPSIAPQEVPLLSLIFSLAISEAIDQFCGTCSKLKWPNDILLKNFQGAPYKKICGILTEMSAESEKIHWVALGFGINANNTLPNSLSDQAISLKEATGNKMDRTLLLAQILNHSETIYEKYLSEGFGSLRENYIKRSVLINKEIVISDLENKVKGKFLGIGSEGALLLSTSDGKERKFFSGDITFQ